jgi:putative SOS response-associated peptidase YedK
LKERCTSLLKPYPSDEMEAYAVSSRVNKRSNNEPSVFDWVAAVRTGCNTRWS